jgi:tripartite-type tricarboxylate transporter receptor subunit TctC
MKHRKLAAALWVAACAAVSPAMAQNADFSHKTITIYIGNTAGGSYDLYGRLVSAHLGQFLPGHPTVVAENMPGAGTLKAADYIYAVAPKDGTALGIVTETLALEQALNNPAALYDARKFTWVGRVAESLNIHMMWHTSKVQSIDDAKKYPSTVAGTGPGNIAEEVPRLLDAVIGAKFQIVTGYPASAEAMLAMQRGEVDGAGSSWAAVKLGKSDWLRHHDISIILQDTPERTAELPNVPALGELAANEQDKQLLDLYASGGVIGRAILAPPGLSPAVTSALRAGFAAMVKDPSFVADVTKTGLEYQPGTGEMLAQAVEKTLSVPDSILSRAKTIYGRR